MLKLLLTLEREEDLRAVQILTVASAPRSTVAMLYV